MNPSLFSARAVLIQGITGTHGSFHTQAMLTAGTYIVAGTSPSKGGQTVHGIPVFDSVAEAKAKFTIDTSVIFVPAKFAKAAILEAIDAQIPLIVCITEGIPIHDMLQIKQRLGESQSRLIGPNCPGLLMPGLTKLGIIPELVGALGKAAIVSRSGTLTYEAAAALSARGIGQKYIIGIGGDPIPGTSFVDCLELFQNDTEVDRIILIGEIGGVAEYVAADYIAGHVTKPVYAYVTGHHAPEGVQLGHAGAILGSKHESADAKTAYLNEKGAVTATNLLNIIEQLAI